MSQLFEPYGGAPLTPRKTAVLQSLLSGESTKSTATKLGISPKTVETYRSRIRSKMNVQNTVDLVRKALAAGLG